MRECPRMLRTLFLSIIPKDLKSKILEEPALQNADHRMLQNYVDWSTNFWGFPENCPFPKD